MIQINVDPSELTMASVHQHHQLRSLNTMELALAFPLTFSRSVLHGSAGAGSFQGSFQELREAAGVVAVGVGTDQPGATGGATG